MPFTHTCTGTNNCFCSVKKIFSIQENKKRFQINNPKQINICQYKVDGCIFRPGTSDLRCDAAFTLYENQENVKSITTILLVELKGSDVLHAAEQISETYDIISRPLNALRPKPTTKAYIVSSRTPSATQSDYLKAKINLKKKNIDLHESRLQYTYDV